MLSFQALGDPCSSSDPDYDPTDPVCATFYGGTPPSPPARVDTNVTGSCTLDSDCPSGQTCNAVSNFCESPGGSPPGQQVVVGKAGGMAPSAAAALPQMSWKWLIALAVLGGGGVAAYKFATKRKRRTT